MDADGLVDLVAAVHGDIDAYDIERGNLHTQGYGLEPSISGIPGVGGPAWPACTPVDRCKKLGDAWTVRARARVACVSRTGPT